LRLDPAFMSKCTRITILLFVLPYVVGMLGTHHSAQVLLVEMGSCKLFAQACLEPQSLPSSASQVARITVKSHCTWSDFFMPVLCMPSQTFQDNTKCSLMINYVHD
jgi:hypothetical protein